MSTLILLNIKMYASVKDLRKIKTLKTFLGEKIFSKRLYLIKNC